MEKEELTIRQIQQTDNQGLYKLIQGILEAYDLDKPGTAYYDPYLNQLYEYYQKLPNGNYWVLVKGNKVFGGIGVAPFSNYEDVAEVQKYYISKDLQGLGYGTQLFQIAESFAKEKGYKKLYVETTDTLEKANDIYEHFGFIKREQPLSGSEHSSMNVWLEKDIQ